MATHHINCSLIPTILSECHSSLIGGHFGFHKILSYLRNNFFWIGMRQSVKFFLQACDTCQRFKANSLKPAGLLQPLPIPDRIWSDISMEFVAGLSISNGHSIIMVLIDRLSKYAHFTPLKHPFIVAIVQTLSLLM